MKVERAKITELSTDGKNAREHSKRNLRSIKASLERFGQQKPIVVDGRGRVVAGNGTLDAARALGWEKVDVTRTGLKGREAKAYAIADNRTGELAGWHKGNLAESLSELSIGEDGLAEAAGFTPAEVDAAIAKVADGDGGAEAAEEKFSAHMGESNNYVVLFFRNDVDWLHAQTVFGIKSVCARRRAGGKWSKGVGRVLDGVKAIARVRKA